LPAPSKAGANSWGFYRSGGWHVFRDDIFNQLEAALAQGDARLQQEAAGHEKKKPSQIRLRRDWGPEDHETVEFYLVEKKKAWPLECPGKGCCDLSD
jgi:hypothetical protein